MKKFTMRDEEFICENCLKKYELPIEGKQLSIFDLEVAKNGMVRN